MRNGKNITEFAQFLFHQTNVHLIGEIKTE
jgi:hypothetical protein